MEFLLNFGYIVIAIALIITSSNVFISSASKIAVILNVPSIIIGTLLIGFGNALPELAISITSALNDCTRLAIGNAYGSNLVNSGLVLGLISIISPIAVHSLLLKREIPWLFISMLLATVAVSNGELSRTESAVLLTLCIIYIITSVNTGIEEANSGEDEKQKAKKGELLLQTVITFAGLIVLSLSSKLFIYGAVNIARLLEISELVIGITIIAFGTSVPELFSFIIAVRRKENDLAIGNLIGSNIFNLLGVIGIAGVISPSMVENDVLCRDAFVTAVMTLFLFVCTCSKKITRINGIILVLMYAVYITYMICNVIIR